MTQLFRYRWQDRYFDNCWKVKQFEQQNNAFVEFETDYDQYQQALADKVIDPDCDYDAEYLAHLRATKQFIRLFYSGGADSHHILTTALTHKIFIDEIVVVTRNLYNRSELQPCDQEISSLAKPFLDTLTSSQVGKISYVNFDAEMMRAMYSQPDWMFHIPGGDVGFRLHQMFGFESGTPNQSDCQIVGLEKPSLLCYKGKWYATTVDVSIIARTSMHNACLFYLMPENIKSYVRRARNFRQRILQRGRLVNSSFELIPFSSEYNYQSQPGKYQGSQFLNEKDRLALHEAIAQEDFDLIWKWQQSMEYLFTVFPDMRNGHSYHRTPTGKFLWFIDLDSLEVFSQRQLIPHGFSA